MRRQILIFFMVIFSYILKGQNTDRRVISAVPFLLIPADSRSSGIANIGSVSRSDVFSQNTNPAKYVYMEKDYGFGMSITRWMSHLVDDVYLAYIPGYYKINDRSVIGASFKIFKIGEIQLTDDVGTPTWKSQPLEFSFDVSYGLKLTPNYSMAIALRYIQSDLLDKRISENAKTAHSVGVDISGYYVSDPVVFKSFSTRFKGGFNISNIGPKISYSTNNVNDRYNNLPTNLKLGGGVDFILNPYNTFAFMVETNKLLIPTPPIYKTNSDGSLSDKIEKGMNPKVGVIQGIIQSFYDAPNGFSEEIQEFSLALGLEWIYNKILTVRTGFYHEDPTKGSRRFFTIGLGFKYKSMGLDLSYLIPNSEIKSPLENTIFFSLTVEQGAIL